MKIKKYANDEDAAKIREGIKASGGHCPCINPAFYSDDTKCMCKNFREAPAGTVCHCGLYIKEED